MNNDREYDLIMTIVNRGFADHVVDAARQAGAHGGTVFYARGSGAHEVEKFFAISIQPEKEVVLNIVKHEDTQAIMHSIVSSAGLKTEAKGLAFALPVSDVVGLSSTLEELEGMKKLKD